MRSMTGKTKWTPKWEIVQCINAFETNAIIEFAV